MVLKEQVAAVISVAVDAATSIPQGTTSRPTCTLTSESTSCMRSMPW